MQTHIIAKTLVFNDKGEVLLLVRSDQDLHRPGGFDLPGGQIDYGEDYTSGAIREALEEANLKLSPQSISLAYATVKIGHRRETDADINIVWLGFVARLPAGSTIKLSHEHKTYDWYSLEHAIDASAGSTQQYFMKHLSENDLYSEMWR